ncbi:hypothetical protein HW130_11810 [Streptomyces sp. PKU-EA00015]|uniref:hypothetical protein n=1 Tax=Streptomyces sp. PKU-EA00015 TaxID=2748326 RepID=UPI0015A229D6|nr:hypothetical protein [Streptomyces sp. PKU-EA00015]NWF26947.1 hypothetical protein [Streptomyces sp. PKU-EA00015]
MEALGWVFVAVMALTLGVFAPFSIVPLLVERRLRRVGVDVVGICKRVGTSEDRHWTSFEFEVEPGKVVHYKTALSDRFWGTPGEPADLVYDPSSPWRRVRTKRQLSTRSEGWAVLWSGLLVEVVFLAGYVLYLNYE